MCAKRGCFLFGATPVHQPERPTEPRLSGVHAEEAEWDNGTQFRLGELRTRCEEHNGWSIGSVPRKSGRSKAAVRTSNMGYRRADYFAECELASIIRRAATTCRRRRFLVCQKMCRKASPLHPHFGTRRARVVVKRSADNLQFGMLIMRCSFQIPMIHRYHHRRQIPSTAVGRLGILILMVCAGAIGKYEDTVAMQ